MTIALWIVNILLALAFLAAGAMKAARPKEALAANGMAWTEDFSSPSIKLIGIAEVIGAVGLIVPLLTGIAPILTPIARPPQGVGRPGPRPGRALDRKRRAGLPRRPRLMNRPGLGPRP